MSDAIGVYVMQCSDQLLRDFAYLRLLQWLIVLNDVEQLALAQLGDQDKLRAGLKGVQEQYNVLMLKFLEDFYLIPHDFDILLLLPFLFNRFYWILEIWD